MIKIGIGGIALTMLSACGNGTPDYDATGTFEATEVIVSAEAAGKKVTCSQKNAIDEYPANC
jgi:HlyD family secretion protein